MFTKLLKHEINSVKNTMFLLCGGGLGSGVLGCLLTWLLTKSALDANTILSVIAAMFMMGTLLILLICCAAMPIILWVRFYKSKFTDEGYLTFTLPVTTHQILLSSLLNILIWMAVSVVTGLLGLVLILLPALAEVDLSSAFVGIQLIIPDRFGLYLVTIIFCLLCATAYSVVIPPMCITIGAQVTKKYKLLAGFGIYYALSAVISFLSGILNVVYTLGLSVLGEDAVLLTILIPFVIQLCFAVGGYFIMHRSIENKLNLP